MNTDARRKDRIVVDKKQIEDIVRNAKILHLGLIDGDFPYIVPLNYGYEYSEKKDTYVFYLHGAKEGHKLDLMNNNPNVCIELETDVELAFGGDIPCQYGSFYSSIIGRGKSTIVTEIEEKKHGLELLMVNQAGRVFEFTEQMIASVVVIKIEMFNYTAKARKNERGY